METDPDGDRDAIGPAGRRQLPLHRRRSVDGVRRRLKDREERVAFRRHLPSPVRLDRAPHNRVMRIQDGPKTRAELMDESCGALDVGEEEGDVSNRKRRHTADGTAAPRGEALLARSSGCDAPGCRRKPHCNGSHLPD